MSTRAVSRVIAIAVLAAAFAQAPVSAAIGMQAGRPGPQPPLRVTVKLAVEKIEKDKVTTTIPFELVVRPGRETTLNHGRSVPTPTSIDKNGTTSINYQSVGSNIMISDLQVVENFITFQLMIDISALDPTANPAAPAFRKYTLQTAVTLTPGQPSVITMSTDQVNAETVRLSVTATVLH